MKLLVFGLGYSAEAAVRALRQTEPDLLVAGTTRDGVKAERLRSQGIEAHLFEGSEPADTTIREALAGTTHLLLSIAPDEAGDPVLRQLASAIAAAPALVWIGYYSTIGVYGDAGGGWVDEQTPPNPANARSRARVAAEAAWQALGEARGIPVAVLRLAGIYGRGRSALDKLREGTARRISKPGQVFNRIHADDIGRVTALLAGRRMGGIFNLADDEPAPPQDVIAFAADLLGLPVPPLLPFEQAEMSPMARSFYSDNKRVSNRAVKAALGINLLHPTYREGLRSILAGERR